MDKFLTGLFTGIIATSLVAMVALVPQLDQLNLSLTDTDQKQDPLPGEEPETDLLARFKKDRHPQGHLMELDAEFLDSDEARVMRSDTFSLIRAEPVQRFFPQDFDRVCALSVQLDDSAMGGHIRVGLNLSDQAQEKFSNDLLRIEDNYPDELNGTMQRFMFEAGGEQVYWFWMTDRARKAYADYIAVHPDDFTFIMEVPLGHLYEFQSVLHRGLVDAPLEGCSDKVNLHDIPGWDALISATWRR